MSNITIRNMPAESRYAMFDGETDIGEESYVDVTVDGATQRVMYHTGVSEDYAGQGLASQLVQFAIDDTIAAGHTVVPVCPYVVKWVAKNTQHAEHVVQATPAHIDAVRGVAK